jgi:hypothetical protein
MTAQNNLPTASIHPVSFVKRMLLGAGIALVLIILFLAPVHNPNPDWGKFWMVKPLIVVPLAGAMGGLFYFFMDRMRYHGGWKKVLANIVSLIAYIFVLWIGTVLGLNGTLWN